jgi:hypothetical protein
MALDHCFDGRSHVVPGASVDLGSIFDESINCFEFLDRIEFLVANLLP